MEKGVININNSKGNIVKDLFNPFPGLRPFSTDESHLFFGREGQSQEVLDFLAKNKFVALLGTSGSGKSSLMYCGVIPILQGGFITKAGVDWKVITCRPGQRPILNLSNAIYNEFIEAGDPESELQKEYIHSTLTASSLGLLEMLNEVPRKKGQNILLLVDQFEELFRFRRIKNNEESFNEVLAYIKLLLEVLKQNDASIYIVLTMRSDFLGECAQFQELTKLINDSHYLIPQMNREDFREAIEGPVAVGGGEISPFLVQQLLNDIGDRPDQLPILQHALMRTWDSWISSGRLDEPIDIKDYENIGKLEKALSEHANEAYNELNQEEKDLCQSIFKTLTEKGGDSRGVRRPTQVSEIAQISSVTPEEVINVVEHFRVTGRSFLSPSANVPLTKDSVIDISHESLMRIWDKLIIWVSEEYEAVQMYKRLADSGEKFQLGQTGLWRPPDLQLAVSWRDKQNPTLTWAKRHNPAFERTMVYLETSYEEFKLEEENKIKQQKRAIKRSRLIAIVLGTASIISMFFMINSFLAKQEADEQKTLAIEQTEIAEQEKVNAIEQTKIAEEQKGIAEKQQQLALQQKELAEGERKKALQSASEAKRQQRIADQKSIEASEQKAIAEASLEEAKRQQELAELATNQAQKLRMLSISQSMAVKSVQVSIDTTLKALLAYQSFLFNQEFEGNEYNSDGYSGLYFAQKAIFSNAITDFMGHTAQVRSFVMTKDETMYSTGSDGIIYKWDLDNNTDTLSYYKTNNTNRILKLNEDCSQMFMGINNGQVLKFNLSEFPVKPTVVHEFDRGVMEMIFIDNSTLVVVSKTGDAIIYDTNTNDISKLKDKFDFKHIIPYGEKFIGITSTGIMSIISNFEPLSVQNFYLSFSEDGKKALLQEVTDLKLELDYKINTAAYSDSNSTIAIGDLEGNIIIYDAKSFEQKQRLIGHTARINDLSFDNKGQLLASASNDGLSLMWNASDYNLAPYQLDDNSAWVMSVEFSDNSDYLITSYANGIIRKWMTDAGAIANNISKNIDRNLTTEEWKQYVAKDIPYAKTIENLP